MVGLDAAGKTTILYKLKLGEIVTTIPTIGGSRPAALVSLACPESRVSRSSRCSPASSHHVAMMLDRAVLVVLVRCVCVCVCVCAVDLWIVCWLGPALLLSSPSCVASLCTCGIDASTLLRHRSSCVYPEWACLALGGHPMQHVGRSQC
jgi:hypothetical protein